MSKKFNKRLNELVEGLTTYPRGTTRLKRDGFYCIGGIMCDIFHRATGCGTWGEDHFQLDGIEWGFIVPERVFHYFGMSEAHVRHLYTLNDNDADDEVIIRFIDELR